ENPGGENPSDPGDNTDNGDSTDPDANPVISQYQVEINGAVSGANITQADGVLNVSGSPNIVSGGIPSCVITTGNKSFTCTVTYMASSEGWSGHINVTVSKSVKYGSSACSTSPSITFSNIKTTQSIMLSTC